MSIFTRAKSASLIGEDLGVVLNALNRSVDATPDVRDAADRIRIKREIRLINRLSIAARKD